MTIIRIVKAKRMTPAILLRDPKWYHTHPMHTRNPNPYA